MFVKFIDDAVLLEFLYFYPAVDGANEYISRKLVKYRWKCWFQNEFTGTLSEPLYSDGKMNKTAKILKLEWSSTSPSGNQWGWGFHQYAVIMYYIFKTKRHFSGIVLVPTQHRVKTGQMERKNKLYKHQAIVSPLPTTHCYHILLDIQNDSWDRL